MTTVTLEKGYKKLASRLKNLEQVVLEFFGGELKESKLKKLELISKKIDGGSGKHFVSHREFKNYLKSL